MCIRILCIIPLELIDGVSLRQNKIRLILNVRYLFESILRNLGSAINLKNVMTLLFQYARYVGYY